MNFIYFCKEEGRKMPRIENPTDQLALLAAENKRLNEEVYRLQAAVDYLSAMTGVDIDDEEEENA